MLPPFAQGIPRRGVHFGMELPKRVSCIYDKKGTLQSSRYIQQLLCGAYALFGGLVSCIWICWTASSRERATNTAGAPICSPLRTIRTVLQPAVKPALTSTSESPIIHDCVRSMQCLA